MSKRVLLGFSGGVDSSVAAHILKEQGYEVTGCFMRNWDSIANNDILGNDSLNGPKCAQEIDYDYAVEAARILDIPLIRKDFIEEYWNEVFQSFIRGVSRGYTPNPDSLCNRFVKFGDFLDFARSRGFDTLAMGHYARKVSLPEGEALAIPADRAKDQTYFLTQITREQLEVTLFPLADVTKTEVRRIASELGLPNADKHGSTGICFIGERHFRSFLKNYLKPERGDIVDAVSGRIIGQHDGVFQYTIGQHKGLNIGGISGYMSEPFFVIGKDVNRNILYVAQEDGNGLRFSSSCELTDFNWLAPFPVQDRMDMLCRFRYRAEPVPVTLSLDDYAVKLIFPQPYAYIAPGQIAALYRDDGILLGGGPVLRAFREDGSVLFPLQVS